MNEYGSRKSDSFVWSNVDEVAVVVVARRHLRSAKDIIDSFLTV